MLLKENRILGVDPGTNILGYGILHIDNKELKVEAMGVIHLEKFPDHVFLSEEMAHFNKVRA